MIDRAIIDKNARIADGVVITPEGKPADLGCRQLLHSRRHRRSAKERCNSGRVSGFEPRCQHPLQNWKHRRVLSDHTISQPPDCVLDAISRVSLRYDRSSETRRSALDLARRRSDQELEFTRRPASLRRLREKVQGAASGHVPLASENIETLLSHSGMHIDAASVDVPSDRGRSPRLKRIGGTRRDKNAGTPRAGLNAASAGLSAYDWVYS